MTNPTISELEVAIASGKHVDLKPDGTATISDKKPRPTIDQVLAEENSRPYSFTERLQHLLNEFSKENNSNTPDFVLAAYMENCLTAFNLATHRREQFYGRTIDTKDSSNR